MDFGWLKLDFGWMFDEFWMVFGWFRIDFDEFCLTVSIQYTSPAYLPGSSASISPPYLGCTCASYLLSCISPAYLPGSSAFFLPSVSKRFLDGLGEILMDFGWFRKK